MGGLLEVKELCVNYGAIRALDSVSHSVGRAPYFPPR